MEHDALTPLAHALETGAADDPQVAVRIVQALSEMYTDTDTDRTTPLDASILSSTDAAIAVATGILPGWEIRLQGLAVDIDGKWVCSLRQGTARDDDEVIGIGKGRSAGQAILAAVLTVAARRRRGYV